MHVASLCIANPCFNYVSSLVDAWSPCCVSLGKAFPILAIGVMVDYYRHIVPLNIQSNQKIGVYFI
jgi:hypothetical protein